MKENLNCFNNASRFKHAADVYLLGKAHATDWIPVGAAADNIQTDRGSESADTDSEDCSSDEVASMDSESTAGNDPADSGSGSSSLNDPAGAASDSECGHA